MASIHPAVRMWSFGQAPREFQARFTGGEPSDWVAHVPESERAGIEDSLLQWRPVYPVRLAELEDGSVIYHGSPKKALEWLVERGRAVSAPDPALPERRSAKRVQLECRSRYRTFESAGYGHTIDISIAGIAFTTQAPLAGDSQVTLHVEWPVRLKGNVPVELSAAGKLARTGAAMAAMQMDAISFSIAG